MARTTYEEVNIGPFTGGLNLGADSSSIGDLDLAECLNMELDTEGALVNRPCYYATGVTGINGTSTAFSKSNRRIIGWYTDNTVSPAAVYAILTNNYDTLMYCNVATGVGATIKSVGRWTSAVQVGNTLYAVTAIDSSQAGCTWVMTNGVATATDVSGMPHGDKIVSHKNRLWCIAGLGASTNGSTVLYSTPLFAWTGTGSGQFTVVNGPGENIVDIMPVFGDLLIFKSNSTHKFSYSSDVGMGEVQTISDSIGASGPLAVTQHENQIYVLHKGSVYDLTSYVYTKINTKLPLQSGPVPADEMAYPTTLTAWSDRLFVGYYGNVFVYSLLTRTWSEWSSDRGPLCLVYGIPNRERPKSAYAFTGLGSGNTGVPALNGRYGWSGGVNSANGYYQLFETDKEYPTYIAGDPSTYEVVNYRLRTKDFDYQTPTKNKRLRFWGAEVFSKVTVKMILKPLQYSSFSTWADVGEHLWNELGTWGRLVDNELVVRDEAGSEAVAGGRKWVKFIKSLRFRALGFTVEATSNGSTDQLPFRIYSLTTYVKEKSLVPKKIN